VNLSNEFFVPASPEQAWDVLLDVERVAGCMPGASLERAGDDELTGSMDVKVGPMSMTYRGEARYLEKDEGARRVVLQAEGKEARGFGSAGAHVTAQLHETDGGTRVTVDTELDVTGRPAQFGRGVLAEVSQQMLNEFARRLSRELEGPSQPESDGSGPAAPPLERRAAPTSDQPAADSSPESLNILAVTARPLMKRAGPVVLVAAVFTAGWMLGRNTVKAKRGDVAREFGYRRYHA
jgi:carbon monoxide dehydrogenase subunit G